MLDDGGAVDALVFESSAFSDPQGNGTFQAMKWRMGEITDPDAPGHDPAAPLRYEWTAVWESGDLAVFTPQVVVPPVVAVGRTYRVRVKHLDTSGKWSHWSPPLEFTAGAPTAPFGAQLYLRVTELMYNPLGGSDFEFVELQNTGPAALDLSLVRFTAGIDFRFADGEVRSLAPGEYVLVVENRAAFASRYDAGGLRIAGEYRGRLENAGETLALTLGGNLGVHVFTYDDAWYVLTDGAGHSLEVVDAAAPAELWSQPANWQPSAERFGTPGLPPSGAPPSGGYRVPADANGDGAIDVSDAVSLVLKLFAGAPLPCDGDLSSEGGNRTLLDANGDELVDISDALFLLNYLFREGPPPARGVQCIRIEGCSTSCPQ
jgi:hypothetical protein